MISKNYIKRFCCEDVSLIENYELAIADETQIWSCHHRRETRNIETGEKLDSCISVKTLIELDLYYKRPASELIFLTQGDHMREHRKGRQLSDEQRKHMSDSKKEMFAKMSEEERKYISDSKKGVYAKMSEGGKERWRKDHEKFLTCHKGKPLSEEHKRKIAEAHRRRAQPWTEERKKKHSELLRNKVMSEEERKHRSDAQKHPKPERYKPMLCVETNQVFESKKAVVGWLKQQGLGSCFYKSRVTGEISAGGYHWRYINKELS